MAIHISLQKEEFLAATAKVHPDRLPLMIAIKEFVFSNNQANWVIFQEMVGEVFQKPL